MSTTLAFLIGAFFSQAVLCVLIIWRTEGYLQQKVLWTALLISATAHFLSPLHLWTRDLFWINAILTNGAPGLFWLFCASLFNDHFKLRYWQVFLVFYSMSGPVIVGKMLHLSLSITVHWLAFNLLEYVFLLLALFVVAQHWSTDLIQARRTLRIWFCGANGAYIFFYILFREVFKGADWFGTEQQTLCSAIMLLASNAVVLRLRPSLLISPTPSKVAPDTTPITTPITTTDNKAHQIANATTQAPTSEKPHVPNEILESLLVLIEKNSVYKEMGLTIGQLAAKLEIPEYKLRQAINSGLGYRNFNDFLNSYRIKEAAERLISEEEKRLPVLTIALDVGFRSLSSFNKAFKDHYQIPPTTYRRQHVGGKKPFRA
jgi:AraC-like DNA-binding protein